MSIEIKRTPFDVNSTNQVDEVDKTLDSGQGIDETQGGIDSYEEENTPTNIVEKVVYSGRL